MYIKIDKADQLFSKYIRTRDNWTCQRCKKNYEDNPGGLHCSHYFGRAKESTRFDPENCDALCYGCHQYWGSTDREGYRNFKIIQLGDAYWKRLMLRANSFKKKDRKMEAIIWKKALESLQKQSFVL